MPKKGGVDFKTLCKGEVKNYSFNPANLKSLEVEQIKKKLIVKFDETIQRLEKDSRKKIEQFYIGKTYIMQLTQRRRKYIKFKTVNHNTWRMDGISERWREHQEKPHGKDGMVVLGVFTRHTLHKSYRDTVNKEDFAFAMEQILLHHYRLYHPDKRVGNPSFQSGGTSKNKHYAYCVYMTFTYAKEKVQTEESLHEVQDTASITTTTGSACSSSSATGSDSQSRDHLNINNPLFSQSEQDCLTDQGSPQQEDSFISSTSESSTGRSSLAANATDPEISQAYELPRLESQSCSSTTDTNSTTTHGSHQMPSPCAIDTEEQQEVGGENDLCKPASISRQDSSSDTYSTHSSLVRYTESDSSEESPNSSTTKNSSEDYSSSSQDSSCNNDSSYESASRPYALSPSTDRYASAVVQTTDHTSTTDSNSLSSSQDSSSEDDSLSSSPDILAELLFTPPLVALTDSSEQEQTQSQSVSNYSLQSSSSSITDDDSPPRAKRRRIDTREEYDLEDQRTSVRDHQEVEEGSLIVKIQNTMVVQQIARQSQPISTNPSSPLSTAPKSPSSQQHSNPPIISCAEYELSDDTSHSSTTDSNSLPSSQDSSSEDDSLSSSPDVLAELLSTSPPSTTDSSPVADQEQTQSPTVSKYSPQSSYSSITDADSPPRAKRRRIDTREEYDLEDQRTSVRDHQEVEDSQIVKIQNTMVVQQIPISIHPFSPLSTAPKLPSSKQHNCTESELSDATSHSSTTESNSLLSSQDSSSEDDSLSSSPDVLAELLSTPPRVDTQNPPSPIMQTHTDSCTEFQQADDISMSGNNSSSQDIPMTDSNSSSSSSQDSNSDVDSSSSSPDELAILLSQQSPFSISRYYSTPGHTPVLKGHLSPP